MKDRTITLAKKIAEVKELLLQAKHLIKSSGNLVVLAFNNAKTRKTMKQLQKEFIEYFKEHEHCSVTEAQKKLAEATTS